MRSYYNNRIGRQERATFKLREVAEQVSEALVDLDISGYFQRSFGYDCVDSGRKPGRHGALEVFFYRRTGIRMGKDRLAFIQAADEVTLFTLLEFLYDHAAKPNEKEGWYHDFSACGWHFNPQRDIFDVAAGRKEWREKINSIIEIYGEGFEISDQGDVVRLSPDGMDDLVRAGIPEGAGESNVAKINHAVGTFRRGRSSREEQKQAIRQLADVLEFYRPQVKEHLLSDDERDLFSIANNYAIRHHRHDQRDHYDGPWLTWLFYLYLSSVHLVLSLVHQVPMAVSPLPAPPDEGTQSSPGDDDIPF